MKNVTIAIDEATHRAARLYAADHGTSISALVKGYLAQLASGADLPLAAPMIETEVREMQAAFISSPVVSGKPAWTPDGKPRRPGALRAMADPVAAELAAFSPDMLASFAEWDESAFDPLP